MTKHQPKGPGGTWKTGQRVPVEGIWIDQHGLINWFDAGVTFPPTCTGRNQKSECAYRTHESDIAQAS